MKQINVAIVDDHLLFTGALSEMVNHIKGYNVSFTAENGKDFIQKLETPGCKPPQIVLLDLNMPLMDGFETLKWIQGKNYNFKVLVLSMNDEEQGIVKSLSLGASGYLLKNVSPGVLKQAMDNLIKEGFYHNELISNALLHSMNGGNKKTILERLKDNELTFLKLCCTDKTYREIAADMNLSHKTIDGYRQNLFEKLEVKSRVGLVLFAMQHKLID